MIPFTEQPDLQIQHFGERELIRKIAIWLGDTSPASPAGIGDDAAILDNTHQTMVVTKDSLVYNKHFDNLATPEQVGAKLLKRNLSDLAAMGATPSHAVLACLCPSSLSQLWIKGFFKGLKTCADDYQVSLVGGDMSSTLFDLAFTLTLLGEGASQNLTRGTAKPGDTLWVTGSLGGSILGKHLSFTPRVLEGSWLANYQGISSAMDISDGLSTDLLNLRPEGCAFELEADAIPISEDATRLSLESEKNSLQHALSDGEDYELLFTLNSAVKPSTFSQDWSKAHTIPVTRIGKVVTSENPKDSPFHFTGDKKVSSEPGYEHFR